MLKKMGGMFVSLANEVETSKKFFPQCFKFSERVVVFTGIETKTIIPKEQYHVID
jgi:hypothetical protein